MIARFSPDCTLAQLHIFTMITQVKHLKYAENRQTFPFPIEAHHTSHTTTPHS